VTAPGARLAWVVARGAIHLGRCSTRQAAMNLVDRPWRFGPITIEHDGTGERWERRGGVWAKTREPVARRRQADDQKEATS